MPASAYGRVSPSAVISAASGWVAMRTVGPYRRWPSIGTAIAAFGALYLGLRLLEAEQRRAGGNGLA
jgi:hypothetical protein